MLASKWRICLFGGLSVRQQDRVLERFKTHHAAALVAYLALRPGMSTSREALCELLWPEADPEAAPGRLRTTLASLRRQLEPPGVVFGSVLFADRVVVRLVSDAVSVDVSDFDSLLHSASAAQKDDERERLLVGAVSEYAGELLPGWDEEWVSDNRARHAESYTQALRRVVRLAAARRDFTKAIDFARRAVDSEPFREDLHRDLIQLYIASGQRSAAAQQYAELERLLRDELGAAPNAAIRKLVEEMPAVAERPGRPADTVPTRSLESLVHAPLKVRRPGLPVALTRFFGRSQELEKLVTTLSPTNPQPNRLITLTGFGGAGKTRISIEAAHRLASEYSGRVWYVSLIETRDARLLARAIADSMLIEHEERIESLDAISEVLGDEPALLVLDNFEQLVHEGPLVIHSLLARSPGLRCLVTSRHRLELSGEREQAIGALPVPAEPFDLESVIECPSVQLFVDRAQSVRPDFQLTPRTASAVGELCAKLEGIPLALELAASRAHVLTIGQILERISERFELLVSRKTDKTAHHRSLQATLEWSYSLHSPDVQRLFRELSVFRGGFTADSACAVCGSSGVQSTQILEWVTQLRSHSLVHVEETDGEMRFRMLETVREFAESKLNEPESARLQEQHAHHYLAIADQGCGRLYGGSQTDSFRQLDREHDNIRTALEWGQEYDKVETLRVMGAMWRFWRVRGHHSEGRRKLEAALADCDSCPPDIRARALTSAGILAMSQGEHRSARGLMEESLAIRRTLDDSHGLAAAVSNMGVVAYDEGDFDGARRYCEEALEIARGYGDEWSAAISLNNLGNALFALGKLDSARDCLEQSLEIRQRLNDRDGIATSLNNLGNVLTETGDLELAKAAEDESLALYREVGNDLGCAFALASLGVIYLRRGDIDQSAEALSDSLVLRRKRGDRKGVSESLALIAELATTTHDDAAIALWAAAASTAASIAHQPLPYLLERRNRLIDTLRQSPSFESKWVTGQQMTLDESVSLALSVR